MRSLAHTVLASAAVILFTIPTMGHAAVPSLPDTTGIAKASALAPGVVQIVPIEHMTAPSKLTNEATIRAVPAPLPAWPAQGTQVQLIRKSGPSMGTNNAVSFWIKSDGSGTVMRVRLLDVPAGSAVEDSASLHDNWVSVPISLNYVGWKHIILSKSDFALKVPQAAQYAIDTLLPADTQAPVIPPMVPPTWSEINTAVFDLNVAYRANLFVDDLAWTTNAGPNGITSTDVVDDFETGDVASWSPLGTTDQRSSVVYGISTLPGTVHGGRVSFRIQLASDAFRRRTVLLPAAERTMKLTQKNYVVFAPQSLFDEITPNSLPSQSGSSSQVSIVACPDQIQAACFCVFTSKPIDNAVVNVPSDLQALGHRFSKDNVVLDVVKMQPRLGVGVFKDPSAVGVEPNALVKDDNAQISAATPDPRLPGNVTTGIPAGTTKEFWITVHVPALTPAAEYRGVIELTSPSVGKIGVPISLNVLPIRLLSPSKQYAINLRSRVLPSASATPALDVTHLISDYVTAPQLQDQLSDIVDHGIRMATIDDSLATLPGALTAYQSARMLPPFIYRGENDAKDVLQVAHISSDSLAVAVNPAPLAAASASLQSLTKEGVSRISFVAHPGVYDALSPNLDVVIYNRDSAYPQQLIRTGGVRQSSIRDWWYWPAASEDGIANRLSTGYLLWRSKLYGAFIPVYMEAFGTDVYDNASHGASSEISGLQSEMLAYPAATGVVDTVRWEAIREGINDVRYLTTMYAALRECKDAHIQSALVKQAEDYVDNFMSKPLTEIPGADVDMSRLTIANYAVALRLAVDAYNKKPAASP